MFRVSHKQSIELDPPTEVFCVKYSEDGQLVALGCNDGTVRVRSCAEWRFELSSFWQLALPCRNEEIRTGAWERVVVLLGHGFCFLDQVHDPATGSLLYRLGLPSDDALCVTSIRFRPRSMSPGSGNVLLATCASAGSVTPRSIAGKGDKTVRVYDEETKKLVSELKHHWGTSQGHSNRIFALAWDHLDENTLLSGGWDRTVQVWDLRQKRSNRLLFGPHICGDGLDIRNGEVLTASWRPSDQLELWDLGTAKKIKTIPWQPSRLGGGVPCSLYTASFSRGDGPTLIAAGGSVANEARVFSHDDHDRAVATIAGMPAPVFTLDFAGNTQLAIAGTDPTVRLFSIHWMGIPGTAGAEEVPEDLEVRVGDGSPRFGSSSGRGGGPVRPQHSPVTATADWEAASAALAEEESGAGEGVLLEQADAAVAEHKGRQPPRPPSSPIAAGAGAAAGGGGGGGGAGEPPRLESLPERRIAGSGVAAAKALSRARREDKGTGAGEHKDGGSDA